MMYSASHIRKSYGDKTVLRDVSLCIPEDQPVILMGPSGCGKSTLFNILLGLEEPDSGEVTGRPARVAAVFQENRLSETYTVLQNVRMVAPNRPVSEAVDLLTELGLADAIHEKAKDLSGGMKRRAAIARALFCHSEALLMDEPFKGLDEDTKDKTIQIVKRWSEGKKVLCITHDETLASRFGGRVYQLSDLESDR